MAYDGPRQFGKRPKSMIPPVKPGAVIGKFHGPIIETERLILRPWRSSDIASNTRMLSDPGTARFITPDRKAVTEELTGWRNAAIISGHWALYGFGMFAVEEKSSGQYAGRVGPWFPPTWPGSRSAGALPGSCAAVAMRSKPRVRRSTGCLRPSRSKKS